MFTIIGLNMNHVASKCVETRRVTNTGKLKKKRKGNRLEHIHLYHLASLVEKDVNQLLSKKEGYQEPQS